jgi:hypothetical protein
MANSIFYNQEGYIEIHVEGDQTYMSFENIRPTAMDIMDELQKKGQNRYGLIDISKQGSFSPDSNRAAMDILESLNYEKVAIIGAGKILQEVTRAIIIAMGKSSNTKIFSDRESGVAWLLAKDETIL